MTEEQRQLVEDNHNLIYSLLHKKMKLDIDEYYDLAAIGLCKAAISFDSSKKQNFSTYAYSCMKNEVLRDIRKARAKKRDVTLVYYDGLVENCECDPKILDYIKSNDDVENEVIAKQTLEELLINIKERDRKVFTMLHHGYTKKEISNAIGVSQTKISRIKTRIKRKGLDYIK